MSAGSTRTRSSPRPQGDQRRTTAGRRHLTRLFFSVVHFYDHSFPGGLIGMREANTAAAYGAAAAPKLNKTQPYTIHNMKRSPRDLRAL